ncbi:hypothetical protein ABT324_11565 [Saccharopolyspora sp. NPDC000359]|uniref:hypothetical protein n=1 Tax=Saccharopolyspora sp. NPDC000359 TaxID=3154251 RepID=UPI00331AD972
MSDLEDLLRRANESMNRLISLEDCFLSHRRGGEEFSELKEFTTLMDHLNVVCLEFERELYRQIDEGE